MRIEGYPLPLLPPMPQSPRPAAQTPAASFPNAPAESQAAEESEPLTPQERLRRLLEERHSLTEAIFSQSSGEGELGKHIDLRV
ncbi:MAG: hypothetical protein NT025_03375 [bacterium]|nr:hypothetical protein [bacterium]